MGTILKLFLFAALILLLAGIFAWDRLFPGGTGKDGGAAAGAEPAGAGGGGTGFVAGLEKKVGEVAGAITSREGLEAARERLGEFSEAVRSGARSLSEKVREAAGPVIGGGAAAAPAKAPEAGGAAPAKAPEGGRAAGTHTVRRGETLYSIARERLGDERHWGALAKANDDLLHGEPERLRPGMVLRLPAVKPDGRRETERGAAAPAAPRTCRVQQGDTLWRIADRELGNGALWERIYEANRGTLSSPDALKPGQTLRLPAAE
jgi:nucleoid-associated protein YgaU